MPVIYGITIIFGLQFAAIHYVAELFELYWRYQWLDIPMHVCGGVLVMLILESFRTMKLTSAWLWQSWRLPILLSFVLLAWEGFGIYRFGGIKPDFWTDSSLDVVCGAVGLLFGYVLVTQLRRLSE